MANIEYILILCFLAITFIQSAYEKIMYRRQNIEWLTAHFAETPIRNIVPFSVTLLTVLELISGILCIAGCVELIARNERTLGLYGAIFSCITLLLMLLGQRMAKDYDGARTIVIYFIPAVTAVYWLN